MDEPTAADRRWIAVLGRLAQARPSEQAALAWSFLYFFSLLSSYYILRPVRDEMGIRFGARQLPWLFTATFAALLVAAALFGQAASRLPRHRLLPCTYGLFLGQMAVFFVLFRTDTAAAVTVPAFFVWLSVFNLFVVSVFWSFMADLFTVEQGERLFGVIAAGGSAGALVGPALAAGLAPRLGPVNLLPLSGAFLALSLLALTRLVRRAGAPLAGTGAPMDGTGPLGGGAFEGARLLLRSPALAGIALLVVGYTSLSTILYFQQAEIVSTRLADPAARTSFFASVDLAVNASALLLQLVVTGRMLRRLGLAVSLALVPLLVALGFLALSLVPALPVLVVVVVAHRAGNYTLVRPGREVLFTAMERASKYKAKTFVDTVVYRGTDAAGAWLVTLLRSAGLGLTAVAGIAVPVALAWMVTGYALGRTHERRMEEAR